MRKTIRVLFLVLVALTVIFALMACNTEGDKKASDNLGGDDSARTAGDADGSEKSEFQPADEKFTGYEFRVYNLMSFGQSAWVALDYSEVQPEVLNADPINDAIFNRNKQVEDVYDITIKEVQFGERLEDMGVSISKVITMMQAGEDLFDAGLINGNSMPQLFALKTAMYDLKALPEIDLSKSWWDQNSVEGFSLGGKLYSATGDITIWHTLASAVFYFNKKLIEDNSLESPYNLVRSGEWTWDKMSEMARDVTKDTSGDGKIDREDQIGITSEDGTMLESIFCAGERLTTKDENDMPVLNTNFDRINAVLDKAMPILRSADYAYASSDLYGRYPNPYFYFTMPKFKDSTVLFYTQQLMVALNLREMEADFGIVPFPKLDKNQDKYYSVATNHFLKYAWIPTTNATPGKAGYILDAMAYYSQQMVTPAVMGVTITSKALRDEESLEMLKIILENRVYDLATIYHWGTIGAPYAAVYTKKTNNFSSEFEKIRIQVETAIQETIDDLSN